MTVTQAQTMAQALLERDTAHRALTSLKIRQNMHDPIEAQEWTETAQAYVDAISKISSLVTTAQREVIAQ